MTTLQQTIQRLDQIKHNLIASAAKTHSQATRQRELKAAVDIHKVEKKLEKILQSLVPFQVSAIAIDPAPNQRDLFNQIESVLQNGVTL